MTAKIISSRITVVPLILVKECQDTWFQLLQKALMNLVLDMGIWGTAQNVPFYEQVQIWQNLSTIFFWQIVYVPALYIPYQILSKK